MGAWESRFWITTEVSQFVPSRIKWSKWNPGCLMLWLWTPYWNCLFVRNPFFLYNQLLTNAFFKCSDSNFRLFEYENDGKPWVLLIIKNKFEIQYMEKNSYVLHNVGEPRTSVFVVDVYITYKYLYKYHRLRNTEE